LAIVFHNILGDMFLRLTRLFFSPFSRRLGMANRFATLTDYHSLILGHGVLAAITFLFIIPFGVMIARFYAGKPGSAIRYHAYLQVLAVGFSTVVFILGFFAVGRPRALTNPHHGIGVAIYVLILLQAIGGRLVRHIQGHSFRVFIHRWSGRAITLLGIVQIPLGLTLYGSPKYLFILYALWMAFLVFWFLILDYRNEGRRYATGYVDNRRDEHRKSSGGMMKWAAPLAAGAGAWALLRSRRDKKEKRERSERAGSRSRSRSRSNSRSRVHSRSRGPEVIPSRRTSYVEGEKFSERRKESGGGMMNRLLGVGAALGTGALITKMMSRRDKNRDEEYSAVATDTPSRRDRPPRRHYRARSDYSDMTEDVSRHSPGRRSPLLPAPVTTPGRPITPRPSHAATSRLESGMDASDYSSFVSPSRRPGATKKAAGGGVAKGLLAGLGLGWFAKKMNDRKGQRDQREEARLRDEEDDRRSGARESRFTGDGYPSPSRHASRRRISRHRSAPATTISAVSDQSTIEPRSHVPYDPAPPTGGAGSAPAPAPAPVPVPVPVTPVGRGSRSQSRSRYGGSRHTDDDHVTMPPMPNDPKGILYQESGSEEYQSAGGRPHRRHSSRRVQKGEAAAAAAVASASVLAAAEERRRDQTRESTPTGGQPVSVKVELHGDRDRNVTLRRLTEEEAAASRRENRRRRNDSTSTLSGAGGGSAGRYRRESSTQRRGAEMAAEQAVNPLDTPLSPPNPAFAAGRRPKDSAYYSGAAGPAAGATVSSLGSPTSRATWSGMSPSPSGAGPSKDATESAAERRRRRRLERRDGSKPPTAVDFD
jgi:hypothetical protein